MTKRHHLTLNLFTLLVWEKFCLCFSVLGLGAKLEVGQGSLKYPPSNSPTPHISPSNLHQLPLTSSPTSSLTSFHLLAFPTPHHYTCKHHISVITMSVTKLSVRAASDILLVVVGAVMQHHVHVATRAIPPKPTPMASRNTSFLLPARLSTPPPLILSKSPYSCIPLPTVERVPSNHSDTLAHKQLHSSAKPICTAPLAPRTPPPLVPYCIPLPPQIDTNTVSINPVLEFTPGPKPPINFDLSLPPSCVTTPRCHEQCLLEPATHPMLPSLTVISPLLPWAITIHRSSINPAFVTVADVLGTIHGAVHISVTEAEFEYLASDPAVQMRGGAYGDRGYRVRGGYQRDMQRLDLFGGKNKFLGLSKSSMGWDTWILNVE